MRFLVLVFWIICGFGCSPWTPEFKDAGRNKITNSINEITPIHINGSKNWLIIRGANQDKPILLFIHGGPGTPVSAMFRQKNSELERSFVVVLWEQRGAGKSYYPGMALEDFKISRFVEDTLAIAKYLKTRFPNNPIFLMGHSWGSLLGIMAAAKRPDYFKAYIGIGQYVHSARQETISYEYVIAEAGRRKDLKSLEILKELKPPVNGRYRQGKQAIMIQRAILDKYGGVTRSGNFEDEMTSAILWCREYSLLDKIFFVQGVEASLNAAFRDIRNVNIFEEIPELNIPIFFFAGKYDFNTPSELVSEYYSNVRAPIKELIWFENSAHYIMFDEPKRFNHEVSRISTLQ